MEPDISLTTFIDFVCKPGTRRITCVREARNLYAEDYHPPMVIDVPRGKPIVPTRPIADVKALLEGEAAAFSAMWRQVA